MFLFPTKVKPNWNPIRCQSHMNRDHAEDTKLIVQHWTSIPVNLKYQLCILLPFEVGSRDFSFFSFLVQWPISHHHYYTHAVLLVKIKDNKSNELGAI